jgi:hypothetical protein
MHSEDELESRKQLAAEMILDHEGLTDDLMDEEAQALINWAVARMEAFVPTTAGLGDEEARAAIEQEADRVRHAMRDINRRVGRGDIVSATALDEVRRLTALADEEWKTDNITSSPHEDEDEDEMKEPPPGGLSLKRLRNQLFGKKGEPS